MGYMMGRRKLAVSEKASAKLAKTPGMHAMGDPPGLYLYSHDGGRSWILRYSLHGKRRDLGLGSCDDWSLAQARARAKEQRALLDKMVDPVDAKRAQKDAGKAASAKRMTFAQCVTAYLDAHSDGWRNAKHREQWRSTLETYANPVIGELHVATVDTALVLRVLEPIWKTKTETASRLRGRIENVLDWARVRGFRQDENPARWKGHLDKLLAKPSKVATVSHFPALPYAEIGAFMKALRMQEGVSAAVIELIILTAARSGEVRGAEWSEIDLTSRIWTIPAGRMKANREHRVALSEATIKIVKRMQKSIVGAFVFPGTKEKKPLSDMSLTAVLRRMKRNDLTVHGFRSTFRDWCSESTAYPSEMAEMALAHSIGDKTEAAYRRGDLLEKRFRMMADWAKYCDTVIAEKGNVVPMKGKRRQAKIGV